MPEPPQVFRAVVLDVKNFGLVIELPEIVMTGLIHISALTDDFYVFNSAQRKLDSVIEAKEVQIERKRFYVELRENDRGKFLRITEEAHGRRNTIIVPSTGIDLFTDAITDVLTVDGNAMHPT
ncbi:MAG: S1 RNA-binding domain-containing protein [Chthoniobacterales bacterium]